MFQHLKSPKRVGKLFPHPIGVFCSLLEAPKCHKGRETNNNCSVDVPKTPDQPPQRTVCYDMRVAVHIPTALLNIKLRFSGLSFACLCLCGMALPFPTHVRCSLHVLHVHHFLLHSDFLNMF